MNRIIQTMVCLFFVAGVSNFALGQGKIEFSLTVDSASGVTIGEESAKKGDVINEDNVEGVAFDEGATLIVINNDTGVKYRLANLVDLQFLGNALATDTSGVAIGRWIVGGFKGVDSSTLISTGAKSETPAATKEEPVPEVQPASTPSSKAASPVGP